MNSRKYVIVESLIVLAGQAVCVAAMIGIFALLGYYDTTVLLGGIAGGLLATANFFAMAVAATIASDKAVEQNVKGGELTLRLSYIGRMAVLAVVLFALVKSGTCNVFASVLPLVFTRPILTLREFFRKGD